MKRLGYFLAFLAIVGLAGASCTTYDPYYYDYAYYDPYYYGYDAWMTYTWVDPWGVYYFAPGTSGPRAPVDVNAAAQAIAQRAPTFFTPSGCVTATPSGATVHYTFNDCTGQLGLAAVNGEMTLTISNANDQLTFVATSNNMTVNGAAYNLDINAVATQAGQQRSATLTTHGHSPDQLSSRDSQGTVTWQQGSNCVEVNSSGSSTRGGRSSTSTLTGFQRCGGACPTAGTETTEGPNGAFTATFNGTSTVMVKGPNGSTKSYNLNCQ